MLKIILFLAFSFTVIFVSTVGFLINYHFKKLGIDNDKGSMKIMEIYKKGAIIISIIGFVSLTLLNFV
jgi:DMSO/TMAO reductase YedYZ heme-binding membrane subunit